MILSLKRNQMEKGDYVGIAAFCGVVVTCLITFISQNRIHGEPWQVIVTFAATGAFLIGGILSCIYLDEDNTRHCTIYWLVQAALAMTAIHVSPVLGFFGILALPLASQSVFLFSWKPALAAGIFLYLATSFVYFPLGGWSALGESLIAYSPGYLFTIGFSFVTANAVANHKRLARLTAELETANTKLRDQAEQAEELATTRERNRVAREIHDGVGHYLTVINVQLEAARAICEKDPAKAAAALDKATRLSREALDDVRRSVGTLRTDAEKPPLTDAIRALTADPSLPVDFKVSGDPRPLSAATEHALYRAAQEGLTNVRKHAHAQRATLELDFSDTARIRLHVADNGQGATASADGFGLRGMRERVGLLGGLVKAGPRPEGGFALTVEVPA